MRFRIDPQTGAREIIADAHEMGLPGLQHLLPPTPPPAPRGLLDTVAETLMSTITLALLAAVLLAVATAAWRFLVWLEPPREIQAGALAVIGLACVAWALPALGRFGRGRRQW